MKDNIDAWKEIIKQKDKKDHDDKEKIKKELGDIDGEE